MTEGATGYKFYMEWEEMLLPLLWTFPVLALSQRSKLHVLLVLIKLMLLQMVIMLVVKVVVGKLVLLLMPSVDLAFDLENRTAYWVWTRFCLLCN